MDGVHDMGGMHGFGPIELEADEPLFHHPWEARVLACNLAAATHGRWNIDMSRYARERTPPEIYLNYSYYEIWLEGLERLLMENGLITASELTSGKAEANSITGDKPLRVAAAEAVPKILSSGSSAARDAGSSHCFAVGDQVRVRNFHPGGHTRAPRYVRGHAGVVHLDHGFHVFPDSNGMGEGEAPQRCYNVRFTMRELWGEEASPTDSLFVDLWDSYLEPVGPAP